MDFATFFDADAAAIVIGGTLVATVLQSGLSDTGGAVTALARLPRRRFDATRARAVLAGHVAAIRREGIWRASPPRLDDPELDAATRALGDRRSVAALLAEHERSRAARRAAGAAAVATIARAADLAPTFGLAGTLFSLSRLAGAAIGADALPGAIGLAVLTTIYGLVLANLIMTPLARAMERAGTAEDRARREVIEWLAAQVEPALGGPRPAVKPIAPRDRTAT